MHDIPQPTIYIIADTITNGIFCSTNCNQLAHALRLYSVRIMVKPAGYGWGGYIKQDFEISDLNNPNRLFSLANSGGIYFSELNLTPEQHEDFVEFRKRLLTLKIYHEQLIATARIAQENSLAAVPLVVQYLDTIIYELSQCDPEHDYYTDSIQSYAHTSGCSPAAAWQELQLSVEGVNHSRLRNLALYIRYRNFLNSSPVDPVLLHDLLYEAGQDFYSRAAV